MIQRVLFAMAVICSLLPIHADAGEVRVTPMGDEFDLQVSVKASRFDETTPVPTENGTFVFSFDGDLFKESGYVERIFVLSWAPRKEDVPAVGVRAFSVEIPVLLRLWKVDDIYPIKAWTFDGIGEEKMAELEDLTNPEDQWRKLLASMQLASHYAQRVRPTTGEARRGFNVAIDALVNIANGSEARWLRVPVGLNDRVNISFAREKKKRDSLLIALRNVESLVWLDLNDTDSPVTSIACDIIPGTFAYLGRRRSEDPDGYRLQVRDSDLIDIARKKADSRCSEGATPPP